MKFFILILSIILISCSARKVNKSQVTIKQDVSTRQKDTTSIINVVETTKIDTTTTFIKIIEPIDSIKEMVIDGHKYQNVRFKTLYNKNGISISKKENTSTQGSVSIKKEIKTDIKDDEKQIDKESIVPTWLIFLIIILLGLGIYEYRKKITMIVKRKV